ncbi:CDP-alcohol phosphatidyltransferase family protein [Arthrobacter agilis]|nr:CDP-alcohol phosphatidyltransferase [Arthrobacter agilis]TPV28124.1 CDP-alcohol phosphatidyltransferase family protein [Arthrobacter agilis]
MRPGAQLEFREALDSLASAQKTSKGAPAYSRYVNRRLGRIFAAAAYSRRMTPNQVTLISAAATVSGLAVLVLTDPTTGTAVLVAALLALGYALDSADGQLARLTGTGSSAGEWLDHTVDAFKEGSIHLCILICWWRYLDVDTAWLIVPLVFQVLGTVHFFSSLLMDQLRRAHRSATGSVPGKTSSSLLYSLAVLPTDFGLLCVLFVLLLVPPVFIGAYSLLMLANLAFLVLALPKWYREVKTWS